MCTDYENLKATILLAYHGGYLDQYLEKFVDFQKFVDLRARAPARGHPMWREHKNQLFIPLPRGRVPTGPIYQTVTIKLPP